MTFKEAWALVRTVGIHDALLEDGAQALYGAIVSLGTDRSLHLVEIGCHYGRSSTLFMLLAKESHHTLTFIDPWAGPPFTDSENATRTALAWFDWMRQFNYPFTLHHSRTADIDSRVYPREIDFLYVDGNHEEAYVEIDCRMIQQVNPGGIVAFDNYGTHPGVSVVVDRYLLSGQLHKRVLAGILMVTEKPHEPDL